MWMDAEAKVSTGQSYRIGTRQLQRVDLQDIMSQIRFWSNEVARLERGRHSGVRVMRAIPRDL
ncbi:hypothetical protein KIK04_05025 [Paenibacillus sp. 481]|nr:hypothetical protein KIK04_05025 [Paenibacillus sp. 481]